MEHRYRDALIRDLDIDELRAVFWQTYGLMSINHKDEIDIAIAAAVLNVTRNG